MKGGKAGKTSSRTVALHPEARAALSVWLETLTKMLKSQVDPMTPVFCSRVRDKATGLRRHISREQAWRILKEAFSSNEFSGKLGTHAMRKTFEPDVRQAEPRPREGAADHGARQHQQHRAVSKFP